MFGGNPSADDHERVTEEDIRMMMEVGEEYSDQGIRTGRKEDCEGRSQKKGRYSFNCLMSVSVAEILT